MVEASGTALGGGYPVAHAENHVVRTMPPVINYQSHLVYQQGRRLSHPLVPAGRAHERDDQVLDSRLQVAVHPEHLRDEPRWGTEPKSPHKG